MTYRRASDLPVLTTATDSSYLIGCENGDALRRVPLSFVMGYPVTLIDGTFSSTLLANMIYLVDTSNVPTAAPTLYLTLPIYSSNGSYIHFADYSGSDPNFPTGFGRKSITLNPSVGDTVQNSTSITVNKDNQTLQLVYWDNNWVITFATI